jgi:hypothetical protein
MKSAYKLVFQSATLLIALLLGACDAGSVIEAINIASELNNSIASTPYVSQNVQNPGVNQLTVAGNMSGLTPGQSFVFTVSDNQSFNQTITITYNGSFSQIYYPNSNLGTSFYVTPIRQPSGEVCTVNLIVTNNISIACSPNGFTISGTVSGLTNGNSIKITNNGFDTLTVNGNTYFTFNARVASNGGYLVTVSQQPQNETCIVSNGAGSGVQNNISNININCSAFNSNSTSYPAASAWNLLYGSPHTRTYSVQGSASNGTYVYSVTGTLTEVISAPSPASFNGINNAFQTAYSETGTLIVGGYSYPVNSSDNWYDDSQHNGIGSASAGYYCVAPSPHVIPATITLGSSGSLGIYNCYTDSSKTSLIQTITKSYVTAPGTNASSISFQVLTNVFDTNNVLLESDNASYNIPAVGAAYLTQFQSTYKTTTNYTVTYTGQ